MKYEVLVNGEKVWEGEGPGDDELDGDDGCFDREVFPAEYRERPAKGSTDEITLITGDVVIAVNRAEDAPTPEPDIVGVGGAVAADGKGSGG